MRTSEDNSVHQVHASFVGASNSGAMIAQNNGTINANFYSRNDHFKSLEDQNCLWALRVTDPWHDKARIEGDKGDLLVDAYKWDFENADFNRWRYDQESQLLWVKGDPGKGKTMLLCGIIKELLTPPASETTVIFFFCQAADARINHAIGVLRGLIFMFVLRHPSLISHIRREYDKGGPKVFEDANAWHALLGIFENILQDPSLKRTYLVIDALDECITGLSHLLRLIVQKSSFYPHVKWLVSSRNWPEIEQTLEAATQKERLCLELNEASVSKAVAFFIHYKVDSLTRQKKYSNDIRNAVLQNLIANAHGTFLWVALVCNELASYYVSKEAFRKKLEEIPAGLNQLYKRMLYQISDNEYAQLCKSILGTSTVVQRPITLDELGSYIELPEYVQLADLDKIIGLCGSFLTLRQSTISLVHQSAKDFLHKYAAHEISPRGEQIVHHQIFSKSLFAMAKTLRRDIYSLRHPGYGIDRVEHPDPDPLAAVRYACLYWIDHLGMCSCQSDESSLDNFADGGAIDAFVCKDYFHWLEAISLMRSISQGISSILKLERLIYVCIFTQQYHESHLIIGFAKIQCFNKQSEGENARLIDKAKDASRFVLYHQKAIRDLSLQLYVSALIFSPVNSITRIQYQAQQPLWIIQKPDMEDEWSPCLQTLEGHGKSVYSVCFSHNSQLLASASTDRAVKIWNSTTKETLTSLEHSTVVQSVSFSHESKLLATASIDSTIQVWDTSNWQRITTIKDDGGCFASVTFIHDSNFLASGSSNGTIKLWDARTGKCLKSFVGHNSPVSEVTISHDRGLLASASDDGTIKIWDLNEGECCQLLKEHKSAVYSVAFSHDSKLLATSSLDQNIKLWDTRSWQCLQTFGDSTRLVCMNSIKFSHDSRLLASGSADGTITLWRTSSGQRIQDFHGHRSSIMSIAFSDDSQFIASTSNDGTVRIWNANSRERLHKFENHFNASLVVSDDYRLLASVAENDPYYIKIWDARNGRCIQKIEAWNSRVWTLMFSSDLKYLASHSSDDTVRVWDISNGGCVQNIKPNRGLRQCFLDNPDLKSFDGTVRLSSIFLDGPKEHSPLTISDNRDLGIAITGECITWNSECLLWLPPDYRPRGTSSAVFSESTVCISCASGRVLFFNFDFTKLSHIFAASKK